MSTRALKSKLVLNLVLFTCLLLYALIASDGTCTVILIGCSGLVLLLMVSKESRMSNRRNSAIQQMIIREDSDIAVERDAVGSITGLDFQTIDRLWQAVAAFYGIPSRKLRATDQVWGMLRDVNDPDHDIFLTRIFQEGALRGIVNSHGILTWADLLAEIHRLEVECDTLATTTLQQGAGALVYRLRE